MSRVWMDLAVPPPSLRAARGRRDARRWRVAVSVVRPTTPRWPAHILGGWHTVPGPPQARGNTLSDRTLLRRQTSIERSARRLR